MSSDSGVRKRNKDKKKKKGSAGDVNVTVGAPLREAASMKLVIDETIHVQKDVSFGGNWCTKLIFLSFLVVLAGLIFFALSNVNFGRVDEQDETQSAPWFTSLLNFDFFSANETPKEVIDEEPPVDSQPQSGYLDILWQLYPFGGNEQPSPEIPPEDAEEPEASKELETEEDSKESNQDDESYPDEENDHEKDDEDDGQENDEKDISSPDDDDNDHNGLEDKDDIDENNTGSAEDSDDIREQFNQHKYNNYHRNEQDSNEESEESRNANENNEDSPDISEEQIDRRDNRYNYYHRRDETLEEDAYKFIRDDDLNDSSELGGHERLDSDENKDEPFVPEDNDNKPEDDSHSSEEVEHDSPIPEKSQPEPKVEENENTQSGNMITKLSVGASLIFVAYSVIIRKWNNYVNRAAEDAEALLRNAAYEQNDENADSNAQSIFENVMDLVNDDVDRFKDQIEKNKTLQEYLETPSQSESEHSEDDSANWQTQGNIPLHLEESETASETENETENSEAEQNSTSDYDYDRSNITNQYDWRHREEIDDADDDLDRGRISVALEKYEKISKMQPLSVRAKYGMARCFDKRAELQKSNQLLAKVIQIYVDALQMPDVPEALFKLMAERAIDRMKFKGDYSGSISLQKMLIERFPGEASYQNDLAVSYLILNKISEGKFVLEKILQKWPNNGLALVNYGFVSKMRGKLEKAVEFLYRGIETNDNGTQDSRFYFHLGDALQKLYRNDEAMRLYEAASKKGIFLSKYQRSLYNVNRLTAKPWWTIEETKYQAFFNKLISNWKKIKDEAVKILKHEKKTAFREESEQLREVGDWRQFEIYSRGVEKPECKKVPVTCRIVGDFPPAAGCRRGQIKFSLMEPGTHVWPHCGPTNCRLRAHLGLIVPDNVTIRVAEEVRSWKEGEILIFDDSFEHEVWHNGTSPRLILIVDVWHPELTSQERRSLTAI